MSLLDSTRHSRPDGDDPRRPGAAQQPPQPPGGRLRGGIDWVVFGVTAVLALGFLVWGFADSTGLGTASASAQSWVITNTGWFFVAAASFFVVFVLVLAASRYGRVPLGRDGERPEFRTVSWIAMVFSAGMGIGLMFWGVAEPLSHYVTPPPGTAAPETEAAVQTAMATTLFHWALHPWAIYAVVGIAIAYGTFRKGRPQLISAAFAPLLGTRRSEGPIGRVIDVLAIVATLFGSAASLGLGALQIGGGLQFNGWVGTVGTPLLVGIIALLTVAFVASAVSGVAKGIQWLSNTNMVLALVLALFVFLVGPTLLILNLLPAVLGDYADAMVSMASRTSATGDAELDAWLSGWTVFYWAWWVSWTPFVGMFIARISRGRTIRQFVTGVLLVPSVVSLLWFAVFGGAGIDAQQRTGELVGEDGVSSSTALFSLLGTLPWTAVMTVLVMVLVAIFFVSGADAASMVMGTLSERGSLEPRRPTVVFWGVLTGAIAALMLVIGSGGPDALTGLQNLTIIAALPFVAIMVVLCVSLYKDLQTDPVVLREKYGTRLVESAVLSGQRTHTGDFDLVTRECADPVPASAEVPAPRSAHRQPIDD